MSIWRTNKINEYTWLRLTTPLPNTAIVIGTYYPVLGDFEVTNDHNFTISSSGLITYLGQGSSFSLIGVLDLSVNKACTVSVGTFYNDVLVGATTHLYTSTDKNDFVISVALIDLKKNDTIEFKIASDTATTIFTPYTAKVIVSSLSQ